MSSRTFGGFVQFREEMIVLIPLGFPEPAGLASGVVRSNEAAGYARLNWGRTVADCGLSRDR